MYMGFKNTKRTVIMCNAITKSGWQCKNTKNRDRCLIHQKIYERKGQQLYEYDQLLYKQKAERLDILRNVSGMLDMYIGPEWYKKDIYIDGYEKVFLWISTKHASERVLFEN